jgi:hypothetical protein
MAWGLTWRAARHVEGGPSRELSPKKEKRFLDSCCTDSTCKLKSSWPCGDGTKEARCAGIVSEGGFRTCSIFSLVNVSISGPPVVQFLAVEYNREALLRSGITG